MLGRAAIHGNLPSGRRRRPCGSHPVAAPASRSATFPDLAGHSSIKDPDHDTQIRSQTVVFAAALALSSAQRFASNQLETADYDYQDSAAPPRPVPVQRSYTPTAARINAASSALPKPTPVPILKQINR